MILTPKGSLTTLRYYNFTILLLRLEVLSYYCKIAKEHTHTHTHTQIGLENNLVATQRQTSKYRQRVTQFFSVTQRRKLRIKEKKHFFL
jgi:hypothetical protein